MEQLTFFDIPSPCIGVCQSDSRGYCKGCLRSRDERFHWQKLSVSQKENVIRLCQQRRKRRAAAIRKAQLEQIQAQRQQQNSAFDFDTSDDDIDLSEFSLD